MPVLIHLGFRKRGDFRTICGRFPRLVVISTDAPYGFPAQDGSYDYGEIWRWVERMPIGSREVEGILAENFSDLLSRSDE